MEGDNVLVDSECNSEDLAQITVEYYFDLRGVTSPRAELQRCGLNVELYACIRSNSTPIYICCNR